MPAPHKRPPHRPPLAELIALREKKYPNMMPRDFAKDHLGITRLHMNAIERGFRVPSMELVLRWLEVLKPEAKIDMFGPLPVVEAKLRALKRLKEIAPDFFKAA
jgi:hypothetical protein